MLGAPLVESPTKFIHSDLEEIMTEIKHMKKVDLNKNITSNTNYFVFHSGTKDTTITQRISRDEIEQA